MLPELIAMHIGGLHPYEKVLTLVLAFGPFLVLGAVIAVRRRHDAEPADEAAADEAAVDEAAADEAPSESSA